MARTRYLKPSFFTNEDICECSFEARLMFAGLWTLADRDGVLEYRPKRIKIQLFPCDDVDVESLIGELISKGFVVKYAVDSATYLFITGWARNQKPHHTEAKSTYPKPTKEQLCVNNRDLTVKEALYAGESRPLNGNGELNGNEKLESAQSDDCDARLPEHAKFRELVSGWNSLPTGIAPRCHKPNAKSLVTRWRSIQRDPEARPYFEDIPKILESIRGAHYCHGQGWFRIHWLFARGKTGELNISKLMEGAYRNANRRPATIPTDPGTKHDPTAAERDPTLGTWGGKRC